METLAELFIKFGKTVYAYKLICVAASGGLDMRELRKQQLKLGLLRASRVLLRNQDFLRQILLRSFSSELLPPELESVGGASDDELSPDSETQGTILQYLMSASTQPSPLKAGFHRKELEVRLKLML